MWKHDALANDLQAYLQGSTDRMVFQNMDMGNCRPDVYTIDKSFAKFRCITYEIKVSRSDFLSDITSSKWHKYKAFSHGVYFAVPDGLVKKSEVPESCGLIVRKESGWYSLKRPMPIELPELSTYCWMRLLMTLHPMGFHGEYKHLRPSKTQWDAEAMLRKRTGKDIALAIANPEAAALKAKHRKEIEDAEQARHFARLKEIRTQAIEEKTQLCGVLGLEPDASFWQISSAIESIKSMVQMSDVDGAIQALQKLKARAVRSEVSHA